MAIRIFSILLIAPLLVSGICYGRQFTTSIEREGFSNNVQKTFGDSLPSDFPKISATIFGSPSAGKLFLSNLRFIGSYTPYLMILDNSGAPLFYRKMPKACVDFKVQPNGLLTYYDINSNKFYSMDSTYAITDSFAMKGGYNIDEHDLKFLPDGHVLMMGYDFEKIDMSLLVPGGNPSATVVGLMIQEIDQQKNVIFQWKSWDHFKITDATHEDLTAEQIDYVHANSLDIDTDGNILLSSRHLDEVTKIDRTTGDIIWRWGGKNNQFTFINDTLGFSHQHGVQRLANGNILLFDNGNFHPVRFSRAVEYQLNESTKTATQFWEYRNTPDTYGFAMGYAQRLDNGNTLISWGAANPTVTEVQPNGVKVYEMTMDTGMYSYRVFRFPWKEQTSEVRMPEPERITLLQSYPNPFNPSTTIFYRVQRETEVTLKIYDALGKLVKTLIEGERTSPGYYHIEFDGSTFASGIYYCRMSTPAATEVSTMLLIK